MTLADDLGLIKNLEHRQMEEEKLAALQDFDPPVSSGWLQKKGHYRHSWKKRFFILTTSFDSPDEKVRLVYFAKAVDLTNWRSQEKYAKGSIILNGAQIDAGKEQHNSKSALFAFRVVESTNKPYEISAGTEIAKEEWLKSIKIAINFAATRDGNPLPTSPTLKNNHTDSTASMTSAASVLVDLPTSYAGVEEVRLLGQTQRHNLEELITKLKFELESDPAIASEPVDVDAVAKLTELWAPTASHPTVRNILSSVSISGIPQQTILTSCLSRLLEIEAFISNEFSDDREAATEAARMLAAQVATGKQNPPPPPKNPNLISPSERRKQRRVRPSQRISMSPGRWLGITGGIGMSSGLRGGRGRSPNPKNLSPNNSASPKKRRDSAGRPDWTEITSPDGSMIYSSPKPNVMRRSSSSEIPFAKRGNRNGVRGNPNFSTSPKSADKQRRASIEAQLTGKSPSSNPKLSRKAKSTPPTSADRRRAFGHRMNSGGHNSDWTHGDVEFHGGSVRNVVKGNVLDHLDSPKARNFSRKSQYPVKQSPADEHYKPFGGPGHNDDWTHGDVEVHGGSARNFTKGNVLDHMGERKGKKPEWDTGRPKRSSNKPTTRAELTKNKKTIYSTLTDNKSSTGATIVEGSRTQISSGNGRKHRSNSPKKVVNVQVKIILHKGIDLEAKDETGTSDPYAKIVPILKNGNKIKAMGQKSKTKMQTCNPEWEEEFDFTINAAEVDHFSCSIKDWNKYCSSQALGSFKISIADVLKANEEGARKAQVVLEGVDTGMVVVSYHQIERTQEPKEEKKDEEAKDEYERPTSPDKNIYEGTSGKEYPPTSEVSQKRRRSFVEMAKEAAGITETKSPSPTRSRPDVRAKIMSADRAITRTGRNGTIENGFSYPQQYSRSVSPGKKKFYPKSRSEESKGLGGATNDGKNLSLRSNNSGEKIAKHLQRNKKGNFVISKRTMTYFEKPPSLSASTTARTDVKGKRTSISPDKKVTQAFQDKMSRKLLRTTPGRIETTSRSARSPSEVTGLVAKIAAMKKKSGAVKPALETSRSTPGNIETSSAVTETKRLNRTSPPKTRGRGESRWQQKFKQNGKTKSFFDLYPNMRQQARRPSQYQQPAARGQRSIADDAQWGRVVDWLSGINMQIYEGIFEEQGLTSLSAIELLEKKDLVEMVVKTEHQGPILKAIQSFSQKTNESIVGINQTENLVQWVVGAFDDGNREVFSQFWDSKLPSKVRDKGHFNYAAGKKIEFYCHTYFAVLPIMRGEPLDACEAALTEYRKVCKDLERTFVASSDDFKGFSKLASAKDVSKIKGDATFKVLFAKEWRKKLRSRLETFLTSVEEREAGSPKKDLSLDLAAVDDSKGKEEVGGKKEAGGKKEVEGKKEVDEKKEKAVEEKPAPPAPGETPKSKAKSRWHSAFSFIKKTNSLNNDSGEVEQKATTKKKVAFEDPDQKSAREEKEEEGVKSEEKEEKDFSEKQDDKNRPNRTPTMFRGMDYKPNSTQSTEDGDEDRGEGIGELQATKRPSGGKAAKRNSAMFVDKNQPPRTDTGNVKTKQTKNAGELNTTNIHEANKNQQKIVQRDSVWGNVFRRFSQANGGAQAFRDSVEKGENESAEAGGTAEDNRASLSYSKNQEEQAKSAAARGREVSID